MDLSILPTLSALTIFVCCFRPLVRRAGSHTNIWLLGWTFLLAHYLVMMLPAGKGLQDSLHALLGIWAEEVCALCFMLGASAISGHTSSRLFVASVSVPVLFQSFLYSFDFTHPALRLLATLLLLAPLLLILAAPQHRARAVSHLAGIFALLAIFLLPFPRLNAYIVLNILLCALFVSASYLTFVYAPRLSRGSRLMTGGLAIWGLSFLLQTVDRQGINVQLWHAILDLPRYIVAAGMILSLLDEYVNKTEDLALHDPLTNLPNRRLFDLRLEQAFEESRRTKTPLACLVIDVDNFKQINDTMGHPVGDGLLQALARRLSWNLGPRDMLARTGGDEFTAILVEASDEYHVRFVAGAMMAAGCVPVSVDHHQIDVRISIGIAVYPRDARNSDELHKIADDAMYYAKRKGGSSISFASEQLHQIHAVLR